MRFIITIITSLIPLLPASGQGEWEIVDVLIGAKPGPRSGVVYPDALSDVQFIDRDIGYFVGNSFASHNEYVVLFKTEDGGQSWNCIFEKACGNIGSIHFVNESKGFSTGSYYNLSQVNITVSSLFNTSDGGSNWIGHENIGNVGNIFFLNDSVGWASEVEAIHKTTNGGASWNKEKNQIWYPMYSLFFIDDSTGWTVGEKGRIYKYNLNDGWVRLPDLLDLPLNKVFFIDQDNGWISGGYSSNDGINPIFMRTVDGGENWDNISVENYLINDYYFVNKDHGWAVGEDSGERGAILETFNGGHIWDVVMDSLPGRLNALHFKDGTGWAVGDGGLILKIESIATGIKEDNRINSGSVPLFQNYPNPFQSRTTISYQLPAVSDVELSIYDITGRKVATLVKERQLADRYETEWNAEGMESGIYFCELKTGQGRQVMKMILID